MTKSNSTRTPDVYYPAWVLFLGIGLILASIGVLAATLSGYEIFPTNLQTVSFVATLAIAVGVKFILQWKNEKIYVLSEQEFEHHDLFGLAKTFEFQKILGWQIKSTDFRFIMADGKTLKVPFITIRSARWTDNIAALRERVMPEKKLI